MFFITTLLAPPLVVNQKRPKPLITEPQAFAYPKTLKAIRETNKIRALEVCDGHESLIIKNPLSRIGPGCVFGVLHEEKCTELHTAMHSMLVWWLQTVQACIEPDWLCLDRQVNTEFSRCRVSIFFKKHSVLPSKELLNDNIKGSLLELNSIYPSPLSQLLRQPRSKLITYLSFGVSIPAWTSGNKLQVRNVVAEEIAEYWKKNKALNSFKEIYDTQLQRINAIAERDGH